MYVQKVTHTHKRTHITVRCTYFVSQSRHPYLNILLTSFCNSEQWQLHIATEVMSACLFTWDRSSLFVGIWTHTHTLFVLFDPYRHIWIHFEVAMCIRQVNMVDACKVICLEGKTSKSWLLSTYMCVCVCCVLKKFDGGWWKMIIIFLKENSFMS